jgi:hypothetical protein
MPGEPCPVVLRREVAAQRHHRLAGLRPARAAGRAIPAVVTGPDVRVLEQPVLEPPLRPQHLLAGERVLIRRKRTRHRARGALVTLLEILGSELGKVLDQPQVRLDQAGRFVLDHGGGCHEHVPFVRLGAVEWAVGGHESSRQGTRAAGGSQEFFVIFFTLSPRGGSASVRNRAKSVADSGSYE